MDTTTRMRERNTPNDVQNLIQFASPGRIAAFIAESIQGVGGVIVFPDGYLKNAYEHVRAAGGVCIADEVQAGFGRTGSHYWGFETQGVIPDIVTMAKGIGNGVPLGAVVTTPQIAQALAAKIHFNTFGGNPVVCAQGRAVLEVIEREGLQKNALGLGNHLLAGFRELSQKHNRHRRHTWKGADARTRVGEGSRDQRTCEGRVRAGF